MSHAAQCILCTHARRRGRLPIACERFPDPDETQLVLNQVLYQLAGGARCASFTRLVMHQDAYFAEDA